MNPWRSFRNLALVIGRTLHGMARVRPGQALAWPLVSGRSAPSDFFGDPLILRTDSHDLAPAASVLETRAPSLAPLVWRTPLVRSEVERVAVE